MNLTLGYQPISLIKWQKHCRETAKIIKNVLIENSKCKRGLLDVFEIQMEDVELSTLETITGKLDYENPQPKELENEVNEDKSTMEKIKNVPKGAILFIGAQCYFSHSKSFIVRDPLRGQTAPEI